MGRAAGLVVAALLLPQPPAAPNASTIHGRVVADDTGEALRNVRVTVAADVRPVLTDAEGRFAIAAGPGAGALTIAKTGFATMRTPPADGVEIRLARGAVITGRVVDERGIPLPMMSVVADRLRRAGGTIEPERVALAETDDHGEYRLFGLAAGDYAVGMIGGARFLSGNATVLGQSGAFSYYPGVRFVAAAQPIRLAPGDEVAGIDLTNKYLVPPTRNASGMIVPPPAAQMVLPPPSEPGPRGTIRGRVLGPDGLPLARARVQLESSERLFSPDSDQTDEDGWYAFHNVAPGTYLLSATLPPYRQTVVGRRTPWERGDLVTMGAGRAEVRVDVTVERGLAISGRVVDEYGDPVENVAVTVSAVRVVGGRPQLVAARAAVPASGRTDDRGRFRIYGLAPGRYVVAAAVNQRDAAPPTIELPGYTRSYHPAAPTANEAALVELRDGEDRVNVDVTLVKGGTARVSGRVVDASGQPAAATVSIASSYRSGAIATGVRSVKSEGTFEFADILPGEYVLQAGTARPNTSTEGQFAARFVTVGGADVTDLALAMSAGSTISGRISFDGGDAPAAADGFELSPVVSDRDFVSLATDPVARADIRDDWTFEMRGVNGPRRLRVVHAPDGWMLKSVLVNGLDVTDEPLLFGTGDQSLRDVAVVLTNRVTEIQGRVADEHGRGAFADAAVVAFASDRDRWYKTSRFIAVADASRDASFSLRGLPDGDYYVAAVDKRRFTDVAGETDNPEFLESLVANATRVTVGAGQRVSLTLRISAR